ncbi:MULTISPECIES: SpoIIIAH-like family protein [unclassified Dehalobacter]|uniref:SpoIIIAH-like family protein n=1 Tax=unclassified Dehalobacter TaxID=2635733 RepID=UPI000E6D2015|nr:MULTISPECIES: SpoIIIAH-like family protein [unclassified Dehalobacter]RJE48382.1 hypothetical protein A7K50_10905 [Dehalobacter sp. MCB1]TCX50451.1 hypothetical protein C1I36_07800 [Dehalobacter sp. 14DCB1]TCX52309.1 hypothetical protein C1I38_09930 [Dehalobacter sp. 12DCB1]
MKINTSLIWIIGVPAIAVCCIVWLSQACFGKQNEEGRPVNISDSVCFSAEIIELTENEGENYFVNYRIKREQTRQETLKMLEPLLASDITETRSQAQQRWLALSDKISREAEIENALKMKGFKDIVSEVNTQKATVTVLTNELKVQDMFIIQNTASEITGSAVDQIEVTVVKDTPEKFDDRV